MSGAKQRGDVRRGVGAHQPIGAAMLDADLLQAVEISQQLLPLGRDLRLVHEILEMLLHGERQEGAEHMAPNGGV